MGVIHQLVPPIVHRFIKPYAIYEKYDDAKQACHSSGYNNDTLSKIIIHKTLAFKNNLLNEELNLSMSDLFLIQAIALMNQQSIKVVDFGGAAGAHYFMIKAIFPDIDFQWHIIEIDNLVGHCQASELPDQSLHFSTSMHDIPFTPDLVLTSGTIQHLTDPLTGIESLIAQGAPYLVFNRLSLTSGDAFWTKHTWQLSDSGPGPMPSGFENEVTECPFAYINAQSFEKTLTANHYRCATSSKDTSAVFSIPHKVVFGENRLYTIQA